MTTIFGRVNRFENWSLGGFVGRSSEAYTLQFPRSPLIQFPVDRLLASHDSGCLQHGLDRFQIPPCNDTKPPRLPHELHPPWDSNYCPVRFLRPGFLQAYNSRLDRARFDKGSLQRMQSASFQPTLFGMFAQRFDSNDVMALGLRRQQRTGIYAFAIQENRIRTR